MLTVTLLITLAGNTNCAQQCDEACKPAHLFRYRCGDPGKIICVCSDNTVKRVSWYTSSGAEDAFK